MTCGGSLEPRVVSCYYTFLQKGSESYREQSKRRTQTIDDLKAEVFIIYCYTGSWERIILSVCLYLSTARSRTGKPGFKSYVECRAAMKQSYKSRSVLLLLQISSYKNGSEFSLVYNAICKTTTACQQRLLLCSLSHISQDVPVVFLYLIILIRPCFSTAMLKPGTFYDYGLISLHFSPSADQLRKVFSDPLILL